MSDPKQTNLFPDGDGEEEENEDQGGTAGDDETCEDAAEGCEPEQESGGKGKGKGKGRGKGKAGAASSPAPAHAKADAPTAQAVNFLYPFNIRYATQILDLAGFVDGQTYTEGQIKEVLIHNGFTEFGDVEPAFHLSEATNTVVITIKGSKKGSCYDT